MLFGANGRAIRAHAPTLVVARSKLTKRGHAMALAYHLPLFFPFLSTHELWYKVNLRERVAKARLVEVCAIA